MKKACFSLISLSMCAFISLYALAYDERVPPGSKVERFQHGEEYAGVGQHEYKEHDAVGVKSTLYQDSVAGDAYERRGREGNPPGHNPTNCGDNILTVFSSETGIQLVLSSKTGKVHIRAHSSVTHLTRTGGGDKVDKPSLELVGYTPILSSPEGSRAAFKVALDDLRANINNQWPGSEKTSIMLQEVVYAISRYDDSEKSVNSNTVFHRDELISFARDTLAKKDFELRQGLQFVMLDTKALMVKVAQRASTKDNDDFNLIRVSHITKPYRVRKGKVDDLNPATKGLKPGEPLNGATELGIKFEERLKFFANGFENRLEINALYKKVGFGDYVAGHGISYSFKDQIMYERSIKTDEHLFSHMNRTTSSYYHFGAFALHCYDNSHMGDKRVSDFEEVLREMVGDTIHKSVKHSTELLKGDESVPLVLINELPNKHEQVLREQCNDIRNCTFVSYEDLKLQLAMTAKSYLEETGEKQGNSYSIKEEL